MKYILLFFIVGCSQKKIAVSGVVDVVEDEWCLIELSNGSSQMHVQLSSQDLGSVKEGDKIFLKVKLSNSK